MSVLSIDLAYEEEARWEQTRREWRAYYKALCSDPNKDGPLQLAKFKPSILTFQPHPVDPDAFVAEWYPKALEPGTGAWMIEVLYSTDVEASLNPLAEAAIVTVDSEIREVPAIFDVDGNPIINTAGDLLTDPPATRKLVDQIIKVSKNLPLELPAWTDTYPGTVNSDAVTIRRRSRAPGTLWFARIAIGQEQNIPGQSGTFSALRSVPYTTVEFELWYRRDGWVELYPNRGFFQLVPTTKQKFPAALKSTLPLTARKFAAAQKALPPYVRQRITIGPLGDFPPEPVFLDSNGQAIVNPTFSDILLLAYDGFEKQPFSALPFK